MNIKPIGFIHTPFHRLDNMPIQPVGARDVEGEVIVDEAYQDGLKDLEGFSHIYLIYFFHKADKTNLHVVPYLDTEERGVFATRSPLRPSHIGLSLVELIAVNGNRLTFRGVDMLDGTPLLDIKPYIPKFETGDSVRTGWMQSHSETIEKKRSDKRFV